MKRYILLIILALFIYGCANPDKNKLVLLEIGNYELTKSEFEEEFRNSSYGADDTLESRRDFLNNLINQKLILEDAQKKNLDKEKSFLKSVEKFWEQSLLRIALDKKTKEIADSVSVKEKNIKDIYEKLVKSGKTAKSYEEMREQIKWELISIYSQIYMDDWIAQLRRNARIKVNYDLLKEDKGGQNGE